jgi:hypothetical protein
MQPLEGRLIFQKLPFFMMEKRGIKAMMETQHIF